MTEPIYSYVRGQGWVVLPEYRTAFAIMQCGTKVRLEDREPNLGEQYLSASSWFKDDGSADFTEFIDCLERSYISFNNLCLYRTLGPSHKPTRVRSRITVIKV